MLRNAILKTLAYSDIFDFPLKEEEIWKFLINKKKISRENFLESLIKLEKNNIILLKKGFYCLAKREKIINLRLRREKDNSLKFKSAKKISRYLAFIPTIKLIGLSGALAMANTKEKDDIDFFIITRRKTIWMTRLLVLLILTLLGKRRKRNHKDVKNKICLNLLIDENFMALKNQDLYTAHEVAQMRPIFVRENIYDKFINANLWVGKFLPNSLDTKILRYKKTEKKRSFLNILISQYLNIFYIFCIFLEYPARKIQIWYMKKNITTEVISDRMLAFHPINHKVIVLRKYEKRLKEFKI